MKRFLVVLMLALAGTVNMAYGAAGTQKTAAVKTVKAEKTKTADFDYDRAYYSNDRRLVYKENGETVYVTDTRLVIFNKDGKQVKSLPINLNGQTPKLYFNNGNYHFFLTGSVKNGKLDYTLTRYDEFGHKGSKTLTLDGNPDFTYKDAFTKGGLRYLKGDYMVFFEVVPDASDNRKMTNEKSYDVRRSPVEYFAFQLNPIYSFEDSVELRKNALFAEMLSGIYEDVYYDVNDFDFLIGGNAQKPEMLFNGSRNVIGTAVEWGDREIFKQAYESSKAGLFYCKQKKVGKSTQVYSRLIVEAFNNKDSLIVGDIVSLGQSVITTGKDYSSGIKNFKNAYVSYYDDEMRSSKKNFITSYKLSDGVKVSTPYIIRKDSAKAWAAWFETSKGSTVLKYGTLTQSGNVKDQKTAEGDIVLVRPIYHADKMYYVVKNGTELSLKSVSVK